MRRLVLAVVLAAGLTGGVAPVAQAHDTTIAVRARTTRPAPNVARWGQAILAGGFQASGDFIYGHSPGLGEYATKGSWPSGTVLEARGYYVENSNGDVYIKTLWRTRRGTTAILSDWNLGGTNSSVYSTVYSFTTGYNYGYRDNYSDVFDASSVILQSYADCSQVAGTDRYQGASYDVTANPNGATDGVSGEHDQGGAFEDNNILDCGEQA